ncbi:MAG: hypothetical protein NTY63_08375 [Candidatus Bipolaricaulota bacterium]|nr:hypothetical protein [Candidatus Bipolaricaulota bacterium]
MLKVMPKRWCSWDFAVVDDRGQEVGEVKLSAWRERGSVVAGGLEYKVSRERALGTSFVLEGAGSAIAEAVKRSVFRRAFAIVHGEKEYVLRARSAWRREMVLYEDLTKIGSVAPHSAFGRQARADLPEDLPLEFRLFVIWLALILWERQQQSA